MLTILLVEIVQGQDNVGIRLYILAEGSWLTTCSGSSQRQTPQHPSLGVATFNQICTHLSSTEILLFQNGSTSGLH